jgi:hypothetical protein
MRRFSAKSPSEAVFAGVEHVTHERPCTSGVCIGLATAYSSLAAATWLVVSARCLRSVGKAGGPLPLRWADVHAEELRGCRQLPCHEPRRCSRCTCCWHGAPT